MDNYQRNLKSMFSFEVFFVGVLLISAFVCYMRSLVFDKPDRLQRKILFEDIENFLSKKRFILGSCLAVYCVALFYEITSRWMFGLMAGSVFEYVQKFMI